MIFLRRVCLETHPLYLRFKTYQGCTIITFTSMVARIKRADEKYTPHIHTLRPYGIMCLLKGRRS
jgi:hypothetical protein